MELGRQRPENLRTLPPQATARGNARLIIAGIDETTISRSHASSSPAWRGSPITNLSQSGWCIWNRTACCGLANRSSCDTPAIASGEQSRSSGGSGGRGTRFRGTGTTDLPPGQSPRCLLLGFPCTRACAAERSDRGPMAAIGLGGLPECGQLWRTSCPRLCGRGLRL